jgi:hypothetical protein
MIFAYDGEQARGFSPLFHPTIDTPQLEFEKVL